MTSRPSRAFAGFFGGLRKHGRRTIIGILMFCCCQNGFSSQDLAIPAVADGAAEAWLVTFAPGDIYWERFGHNAVWIREPRAGLDHTFNFGFFDFEQQDFFLRFLRGRMLYFSVAQPAVREFEFYRGQNRSIRAQKLQLEPLQYRRLRDYLLNEIQPENRDYRYDYFFNNCSTRIRDALDEALDGRLSSLTETLPAKLNLREHTRRLTQMQYWFYLGLELGLGYPVDRRISRWEEMFVPMVVADQLASMTVETAAGTVPVASVDTMLFESDAPGPASVPDSIWHRYLLLGLLVTGIAWLSGKFMPPVWLAGLCRAWVLISASGGLALVGLWSMTDHEAARLNANVLLMNPLFLLALVPAFRKAGAALLAGGVPVALGLLLLPGHQYNLDVLALLAPVNLSAAAYLWLEKSKAAA